MLTVVYRPTFLRQYKKLPPDLQEEVKEKIERFRKNPQDPSLKVHKLHGKLRGSSGFWVNYRDRVVYEYESKNRVALLAVGDHDVYK